jgi:hypothetical protein
VATPDEFESALEALQAKLDEMRLHGATAGSRSGPPPLHRM